MDSLLEDLRALPSGDAVFDLDGTLLVGDIGEAALRRVLAEGTLPDGAAELLGAEDPWQAYLALDPVAQCVAAALALAGRTRTEVERLVDDAFASGEVAPNPPVCELAACVARHHRVWVLTGSAEVLGEAVAPRLGLRWVRGVRLPWNVERLGNTVEGIVTCAEGKIEACRSLFPRPPVFAIGDSPWDLPLLRFARHARTCGRIAGQAFPSWGQGGQ